MMSPRPSNSSAVVPVASRPAPVGYATPAAAGPRRRVRHAAAVAFASVAIPLSGLYGWDAFNQVCRWGDEPTTTDRRAFGWAAVRFAGCGGLLLVPGVYYGRLGLRGDRPGT